MADIRDILSVPSVCRCCDRLAVPPGRILGPRVCRFEPETYVKEPNLCDPCTEAFRRSAALARVRHAAQKDLESTYNHALDQFIESGLCAHGVG